MATIKYNDTSYTSLEAETVLDTLLRNEVDVMYSCKTGVCHTCMLRSLKDDVPAYAQQGIKKTLRLQNYFLPCLCKIEQDMDILSPDDAELFVWAMVKSKEMLAPDICRVILEMENPLYYHAGQFINLRKGRHLLRSYSLASLPQEDALLEIHIKRLKNGKMSNWIFDDLEINQSIEIEGPFGNCFYTTGKSEHNLLLIGTGTGLSPLLGIVRDALHNGHEGDIYLYHGSRSADGLYLQDKLFDMQNDIDNFYYQPCISGEMIRPDHANGRANDIALAKHSNLDGWTIYLCGAPSMVKISKKFAYLAGAKIEDIYSDPFEMTELRTKPRS